MFLELVALVALVRGGAREGAVLLYMQESDDIEKCAISFRLLRRFMGVVPGLRGLRVSFDWMMVVSIEFRADRW